VINLAIFIVGLVSSQKINLFWVLFDKTESLMLERFRDFLAKNGISSVKS